jgi:glyoxylase-like metal-dependent hydrolase (beta-lactamase superfamily II)
MGTWTTVARGVHQHRGGPFDLSVVVVEGGDGLLVVDTGADPFEADELLGRIAARFAAPVRWVVNTHAHFDHTFGNQAFGPDSATDAEIHGHAGIPAHFERFEGPRLAAWRADPDREPGRRWHDVRLVAPTHPVERMTRLDLGDRVVELRPQPPAHTDTDLVLFVPDVRVWIVGDLVEESGPPMYGSGCYPLDWPAVVEGLVAGMRAGDIVVPGHGRIVDRAFAARQAAELSEIARRFREAHDAGRSAAEALAAHTEWPVPVGGLVGAVERAYAALDGTAPDEGRAQDA